MSKEILAGTYEVKRFQIMDAYRKDAESVSPALAYAYDKRVAPVEHNQIAVEAYGADPFDAIYAVNTEFMQSCAKHIDEKWREGNLDAVAFSKLEDHFGGYRANRMELAHALRYFRLCGLFDDDFFKAVMKSAPIEAHSIMEAYEAHDVELD